MRLLMVSALLLRVAIPAGYMPASIASDGWYLQWCPNGVSAEVMAALFETARNDHGSPHSGQHHQHHRGQATHLTEEVESAPSGPMQCDFGVLGADVHAAPDTPLPSALVLPTAPAILVPAPLVDARPRAAYRSRAPPRSPLFHS